MNSPLYVVFRKELSRFFGDKRILLSSVILPGLLIFVLYNLIGSAITDRFSVSEDYRYSVSVAGESECIVPLLEASGFDLSEKSEEDAIADTSRLAQKENGIDLVMILPDSFDTLVASYDVTSGTSAPAISIYYNSTSTHSQAAFASLQSILSSYETTIANKFDVNRGDYDYDMASEKDITGTVFSSMLPMLMMIFLFSGCMAVAPESIAGEKERGTLATLLITPAKRGDIALGKILALSVVALLSGLSSALGTILSLPKLIGGMSLNGNVYTVREYLYLGVIILTTVLLLITLVSIISAFAKSTKEAGTLVMPLMIIVMLVGVSTFFSESQNSIGACFIPLYNSVRCMGALFSFKATMLTVLLTAGVNIVCSALGVYVLTRMFNSEKCMFSH